MSRLILLAAIIAVIYLVLKSYRGRSPKQPPERTEDMVRCAQCGVHLPRSESILADGKYYCSDAHRRGHQSGSKNI